MDITLFTTVKLFKHKLELFEHTQSMSKYSTGSVYIGNIINYLPDPLPRGLEVGLQGRSTFPILKLSIQIDRLGGVLTSIWCTVYPLEHNI